MIRLTGRGTATATGSVAVFAAGLGAGYPVLLAVSAAAFGAVVAAVAIAARRPRVTVEREVYPDRVHRGRPAFARLKVTNPGTRRQPGFTAGDRLGAGFQTVSVRALPPNGQAVHHYELPTEARGRHVVGPLTVDRGDPLGLGTGRLTTGETATVWVHPRVHPMRAIAAGHPRHHHEGRSTDDSLHGSLDLRDVREYVVGDEVRHLHWKATARTGQLMVREYVDPDQPRFTALLDTRRESGRTDLFEDAVDLTASLVVSAATADQRCRLVTSCGLDLGTNGGAKAARRMLDELCTLDMTAEHGLALAPGALSRSGGGTLVVVLTALADADRAAIAALRPRYSSVIVIVLDGRPGTVPGAKVVAATGAADAVRRWNAVVVP